MKVEGENYTLYLGDCLEIMPTLDAGSVDAVVTDPPYGIGADKGTDGFGVCSGKKYSGGWDDSAPSQLYFDELLDFGNAIIFGGNYFTDKLPVGRHWIVWDKVSAISFQNPFSDAELLWTNYPKKTVKKYTVIQQGFISEEKNRFHPTQKPVKLLKMIINDYVDFFGVVLDPFMGSGTTGVAALRTGRKFIGIEKDPHYFEIARQRIEDAARELRGEFKPLKDEKVHDDLPLFCAEISA